MTWRDSRVLDKINDTEVDETGYNNDDDDGNVDDSMLNCWCMIFWYFYISQNYAGMEYRQGWRVQGRTRIVGWEGVWKSYFIITNFIFLLLIFSAVDIMVMVLTIILAITVHHLHNDLHHHLNDLHQHYHELHHHTHDLHRHHGDIHHHLQHDSTILRSGCPTCRSTRLSRSGTPSTSTTPPRSGCSCSIMIKTVIQTSNYKTCQDLQWWEDCMDDPAQLRRQLPHELRLLPLWPTGTILLSYWFPRGHQRQQCIRRQITD